MLLVSHASKKKKPKHCPCGFVPVCIGVCVREATLAASPNLSPPPSSCVRQHLREAAVEMCMLTTTHTNTLTQTNKRAPRWAAGLDFGSFLDCASLHLSQPLLSSRELLCHPPVLLSIYLARLSVRPKKAGRMDSHWRAPGGGLAVAPALRSPTSGSRGL